MDRTFLTDKRALVHKLQEKGLHLTKNRGQNFLIGKDIREKLGKIIPHTDCILEVGAGLGHFTLYLESKASHLLCIELDSGFIPILRDTFPKAVVLHQDFLTFFPEDQNSLLPKDFVLVGNLPYYASTKILSHILRFQRLPKALYIMLEKDFVKDKLQNPQELLGLQLSFFYEQQDSISVSRENFFPRPNKDSRFVALQRIRHKDKENEGYCDFLSLLFQNRRSPLSKAISSLHLPFSLPKPHENILSLRVHQVSSGDLWDLYTAVIRSDKDAFQKFRSQLEPSSHLPK